MDCRVGNLLLVGCVTKEWAKGNAEKNPDVCVGIVRVWAALRKLHTQNPTSCRPTGSLPNLFTPETLVHILAITL